MSEIMSLLSDAGPSYVVSESSLFIFGPRLRVPPGSSFMFQDPFIQRRGPLSRTEDALLSIYVLVLELGTRPQCTTTFLRDARALLSGIGPSSRTSILIRDLMLLLQLKDDQRGLIPPWRGDKSY